MKKESIKNIVIFILILIVIALLIIYSIKFSNNAKTGKIIEDSLAAQSKISEYIGKIKSDTFDIYATEQLLLGSTDIKDIDGSKIKDNDDKDLLQIVNIEDKITKNESVFYKLNTVNLKKIFDISLYEENRIMWYVKSTGEIKVNYINKPTWWNQELDILYVGN
jgi:uncharacterized protein YpmB